MIQLHLQIQVHVQLCKCDPRVTVVITLHRALVMDVQLKFVEPSSKYACQAKKQQGWPSCGLHVRLFWGEGNNFDRSASASELYSKYMQLQKIVEVSILFVGERYGSRIPFSYLPGHYRSKPDDQVKSYSECFHSVLENFIDVLSTFKRTNK